jgi:hypothetical protein
MSAFSEAVDRVQRSPRVRAAIVLVVGLAAFVAAYTGLATSGPALCPSRLVFETPCATCGMTRAFAGLLHADLEYALRANAGSPLAFAIVLAHGLAYLAQLFTGRTLVRDFWANRRSKRVAGALLLSLVLFSAVSNFVRHREGRGPLHLAPWSAAQLRPVTH